MYKGAEGPIDLGKILKPVELFLYYLPIDLWRDLRDYTNDEIQESGSQARLVSCHELKLYAAIILHMMINPNHRLKAYWSTDEEKRSPWIIQLMHRNRWFEIHQHVLFDLYMWEETLALRSCAIYTVGEHVGVDEGIVSYKGYHQDSITIRSKSNSTGAL